VETILWGALGGGAVLVFKNVDALTQLPATLWGGGKQVISSITYCYYEAIESVKDLVAESRMEYEAEAAAIAEVRWGGTPDIAPDPGKINRLRLVN
jgi:hypothetical protein